MGKWVERSEEISLQLFFEFLRNLIHCNAMSRQFQLKIASLNHKRHCKCIELNPEHAKCNPILAADG